MNEKALHKILFLSLILQSWVLHLSSDPKINLNTMILFISTISHCEESPQFGVSHSLHK
jgi:hypothetical protein